MKSTLKKLIPIVLILLAQMGTDSVQAQFDLYKRHPELYRLPVDLPLDKWKGLRNNSIRKIWRETEKLETLDWSGYVAANLAYIKDQHMNDWDLTCLIAVQIEENYPKVKENAKRFLLWFVLREMGYDLLIMESGGEHLVLMGKVIPACTDISPVQEGKKDYSPLYTHFWKQPQIYNDLTKFSLVKPKGNREFDFTVQQYPTFPQKLVEVHTLPFSTFNHRKTGTVISFEIDTTLAAYIRDYPRYSCKNALQTCFSTDHFPGLRGQLASVMQSLEGNDKLFFLLDFVRKGFPYKYDDEAFGEEWPLFPEEFIFHGGGDCEDKSAWFAALVREFLGLDMVFIHYRLHATVGVAIDYQGPNEEHFVEFQGKKYFICDPTGSGSNGYVGLWKGVRKDWNKFEMIFPFD